MSNVLKVFRYDLTRNLHRRGYLLTTFGLPVLALVVTLGIQFFTSQGQEGEPTDSDLPPGVNIPGEQSLEDLALDFDLSIDSAGYIDEVGAFDGVEVENITRFEDEASARAALEAGEIEALYILPDNYLETGDLRMVVPELSLNQITTQPVSQLLFTQLAEAGVAPATLLRLRDPVNLNPINLERIDPVEEGTDGIAFTQDAQFVTVILFAILFFITVFGTSGYLMQSVIEEKESRLVEILLSTVRPMQLLSGKILAMGFLGLFQVGVWIAFGVGVFLFSNQALLGFLGTLSVPLGDIVYIAIYFILGYLMFAAVFAGVGALSNSLQEGPQFTIVFILPVMIPFYTFGTFMEAPNSALPVFLSIFPLTSPLAMVMRLSVTAVPFIELALSIGLLALAVIGLTWAAGRLFRVQTLLAGQVPKVRQIPSLIFGRS